MQAKCSICNQTINTFVQYHPTMKPKQVPAEFSSLEEAIKEAKEIGWRYDNGQFYCLDCLERE